MTEHTHEQYEAIRATEDQLTELAAEIGLLYNGEAQSCWNIASTLVGRDLNAISVGELRKIIRELS
jgi:hypothetical protein